MANISVSLPSDGETIDVADYNTPINTIVNEINGGLDNSNITAAAAIAGSKLADVSVAGGKLGTVLGVQANRSSVLSIANNTSTAISWNAEAFDNGGFFSGSGTDLIVPSGQGGLYLITMFLATASGGTGNRSYQIRVGATDIASESFTASADPAGTGRGSISVIYPLAAADVVTGRIFQNNGGALNLSVGSYLSLVKLGTT